MIESRPDSTLNNQSETTTSGPFQRSVGARRDKVAAFREGESETEKYWYYSDSSLKHDGTDRSQEPFSKTFFDVLPGADLKEYVEAMLANRKGLAVGLEIGGVGYNLFGDFSPDFFTRTAGIALVDRGERLSEPPQGVPNHSVIEGDIFEAETRRRVFQWVGPEGVDFVIERMGGGRQTWPEDPIHIIGIMSWIYSFVREGGLILAQLPYSQLKDLPQRYRNDLVTLNGWVSMIQAEYVGKLEVALGEEAIRLNKLTDAPEKLPLLAV
ncbi:MAG TPA: hypothetical protein PK263_03090 [bacterium]|nr:hypothetical protein [bacterium]